MICYLHEVSHNAFEVRAVNHPAGPVGGYLTAQRYATALSPSESRETFQLNEKFGIEPFLTEPDVLSPVDMAFDARGPVYVVEMGDYPYDTRPGHFKGRIRLLRDPGFSYKKRQGSVNHTFVVTRLQNHDYRSLPR